MKITTALYLVSSAAGLLLARPAVAQDARVVVLRLRKTGDTVAVRNAQLTIDHTIEAVTDSLGIARIPDLDDGGHVIEAVARGYQAFFDTFRSGPGIPTPIDLELLAVEVTAKAKGVTTDLTDAGFDQRRAKGQGKFFTLAQLKAAGGRPLANLLKVDAGALIASGARGESYLGSAAPTGGSAPCYAAVVKNGLRIYPFEGATPPDLDKIFTDDLKGIELYARGTGVPTELREVATCGALVLWSR